MYYNMRKQPWCPGPEKADTSKVWYNKTRKNTQKKETAEMGRRSEFTREEKIAAVKLVTEGGRNILSVANEYGIHENTLWKWKRQYGINPEGAFTGEKLPASEATEDQELARLRRRIRELEEENEFLKKVSAYFAKSPR